MRRFFSGALELVYPRHCLVCHDILVFGSEHWLCKSCHHEHPVLRESLCIKCGQPLAEDGDRYCYDCHRIRHYFKEGRALWVYEGEVKERIKDLKYSYKTYYGRIFGQLMADYFQSYLMWPIDMVVPVPLHKKKLRKRGFNQVDLICKDFTKQTGLSYRPDLIVRHKYSRPQKALTDDERRENVINAFKCRESTHKYDIMDKSILIVDDIYTTGSTVDGIAQILMEAGAKEIYCLTVAIGKGLS